ncbi:MAG: hypothetical protein QM723_27850 [Myxococcaceae bacterium]
MNGDAVRKRAQDRRHTLAALLLSLVFHAGGAFLLLRYAPAPKPVEERKPIEVEFRIIPRETPAPVPQQAPVPAQQAAKTAAKSKAQSKPQASEPHPAEATPPSALSFQERGSRNADEPRANGTASLQPRISTVLPGIGNGEGDDAQGHTVVNGPGEDGDPDVIAEYTREKVGRKAQNLVDGLMGDAARNSGTLPPYFSKVQSGMMDGFGKLLPDLSEKTKQQKAHEALDPWLVPAESYGKTGSPFANPDDARAVTDTGLGRIAQSGGFNHGDPGEAAYLNGRMQQLGAMQAMMNASQRARLKTVLEIRQTSSGALAETVVLEKSGDAKFDEWVIHQTRRLISDLGETEDGDTPWHDESSNGFRSVWQFTWEPPKVKVKLIRVMRTEGKVE